MHLRQGRRDVGKAFARVCGAGGAARCREGSGSSGATNTTEIIHSACAIGLCCSARMLVDWLAERCCKCPGCRWHVSLGTVAGQRRWRPESVGAHCTFRAGYEEIFGPRSAENPSPDPEEYP